MPCGVCAIFYFFVDKTYGIDNYEMTNNLGFSTIIEN